MNETGFAVFDSNMIQWCTICHFKGNRIFYNILKKKLVHHWRTQNGRHFSRGHLLSAVQFFHFLAQNFMQMLLFSTEIRASANFIISKHRSQQFCHHKIDFEISLSDLLFTVQKFKERPENGENWHFSKFSKSDFP